MEQLTSLERVSLILQHKEADRIPVYPLINSISWKSLGITYEEWTKDPDLCARAIMKATDEIGVDVICSLVDLSVEAADWGQELIYSPIDAACPNNVHNPFIKTMDDYKKIGVLDPRKTPRMGNMIRMCKHLADERGKEMPIVGFVFGPFALLSMLRGQSQYFLDMMMEPDVLHEALRNVTETLKEYCLALIEAGCHAIMFDTLFASGSIMSPAMWESFEGEYIKELCDLVHQNGAMVMLHNCGENIYFDMQEKYMQPEAFSYCHLPPDCPTDADLKNTYGKRTTLIGMIDPGWMMTATEESLRAECRRLIDAYKKDGGFILATGCEYPAPMDQHFAKVMVEEAKTYGRY